VIPSYGKWAKYAAPAVFALFLFGGSGRTVGSSGDGFNPITILIMIAAGAMAYFFWKEAQKRKKALIAYAHANGWTYLPSDDTLVNRYTGDPFGEGHARRAINIIRGVTPGGRKFQVFEYSYTVGHGKNSTTYHYRIATLVMPTTLPQVSVVPESALAKLTGSIGVTRDQDFELDAFNNAFTVQSGNPKTASDILHPRLMEKLVADPFAFRTDLHELVSWERDVLTVESITPMVERLTMVLDAMPRFLWKHHGVSDAELDPQPIPAKAPVQEPGVTQPAMPMPPGPGIPGGFPAPPLTVLPTVPPIIPPGIAGIAPPRRNPPQ
jgi:hypothetical protein